MPKKIKIKKSSECVKVVVRCRPILKFEKDKQHAVIVKVDEKLGEI